MNDLISRSALVKKIRDYADEVGCVRGEYELANGILKAISVVEDAPTVEAKPVVHGKWIEFDIDYGGIPTVGYQCSECGQSNGFITDFCPNCGADMRGEKND